MIFSHGLLFSHFSSSPSDFRQPETQFRVDIDPAFPTHTIGVTTSIILVDCPSGIGQYQQYRLRRSGGSALRLTVAAAWHSCQESPVRRLLRHSDPIAALS